MPRGIVLWLTPLVLSMAANNMRLSVIIPVHNAKSALEQCLHALAASSTPADQVIVVDDASSDGSAQVARDFCKVIAFPSHVGAAAARNCGASAADGDVLVFLDADVAVHPDTLARIVEFLAGQPAVAAIFGSYDAQPPVRTLVSLYKNLLHHYIHQHGRREASTFWTGCGAVRAQVFRDFCGFDARQRMLEDIEFGIRLRRAGHRVCLVPDIQVTHLKQWTLGGLLRSDILDRAVPWSRLILRERNVPNDLNLDSRNRLGAAAVWAALLFAAVGFWFPWSLMLALLSVAVLVLAHMELYQFFARQGGFAFALGAICLHALYFLYSSAIFAGMLLFAPGRPSEEPADG